MRRVAGELGVATMSLYRHVTDKDDLLARMMDASFSEWPFPDDPPEGWRDRLELATRMLTASSSSACSASSTASPSSSARRRPDAAERCFGGHRSVPPVRSLRDG
jgi:AcrR family transcriptional regulator